MINIKINTFLQLKTKSKETTYKNIIPIRFEHDFLNFLSKIKFCQE